MTFAPINGSSKAPVWQAKTPAVYAPEKSPDQEDRSYNMIHSANPQPA